MRRHTACLIAILLAALTSSSEAETTLTILTHYTAAQRAPLTACLQAYERDHPGIRIIHQQSEIDDYLQTVLTARLGGNSPDIYNVYSMWSAQLAGAGVLDKPPPEIARLVSMDYVPSTLDAIKVDGQTWGIPAEVSTFMLIYNKKLFQSAGIETPPHDWDGVIADAGRITRRNRQGKITTAGFAFGPSVAEGVYPFSAMLLSRGIEPFTAHGTNLTTPDAVAALTGEARLFAQGITDNTIQTGDFPGGAVGMMIYANWYKDTLRQAFGPAMNDTVGVAAIPAGDNWKTLQYAFFWAVDAASPNKQQAWDLLAWLNTPHAAHHQSCTGEMLGKLGALTGNHNDIIAGPDEYGDAFSKPFADAIASGRAMSLPNGVHDSEIQQALRLRIGRAWSGQQTPQAALRAADRTITAILTDAN